MEIAHRLRMLAVHNNTSKDIQNWHKTQPKGHEPGKYIFYVRSDDWRRNKKFYCHSPTTNTKTAGGMTKIPTIQSATARLITKRFVTVLNLLVVMTDKITNVFPIIVIIISKQNKTINTSFVHGQFAASALFSSVTFIFNQSDVESSKARYGVKVRTDLRSHFHRFINEWVSYVNLSIIAYQHLERVRKGSVFWGNYSRLSVWGENTLFDEKLGLIADVWGHHKKFLTGCGLAKGDSHVFRCLLCRLQIFNAE